MGRENKEVRRANQIHKRRRRILARRSSTAAGRDGGVYRRTSRGVWSRADWHAVADCSVVVLCIDGPRDGPGARIARCATPPRDYTGLARRRCGKRCIGKDASSRAAPQPGFVYGAFAIDVFLRGMVGWRASTPCGRSGARCPRASAVSSRHRPTAGVPQRSRRPAQIQRVVATRAAKCNCKN